MNPVSVSDTIVQEITIQGAAERIFEALVNPNERVQWWRTAGRFEVLQAESDLRVGGKWMMRGTGQGGRPFVVQGEYRRIERPRLLEFTWLPDWQGDSTESVVCFDLEESAGLTTVRLTHSGLTSQKSRTSHQGWPFVLGLLQAYVQRQG